MPDQWDPRVYRRRAEAWRQRAALEEEDEQRHAACLAIADGYDKLASSLEDEERSKPAEPQP